VWLRERQKRNLLATLFVSQGVPMLVAGDEMGRTQKGNNNTYCQDNQLSWVDWNLDERRQSLLDFTRRLIHFRGRQPTLQRRRFFRGEHVWDSTYKDVTWLRPDGSEMDDEDWQKPFVRSWMMLVGGDSIETPDEQGERIVGDGILVLFNAHHEAMQFALPAVLEPGEQWWLELDTSADAKRDVALAEPEYELPGRALAIIRHPLAK
ncbi:MAG TPA: glycogen debranching enzyme GlgX, partial [Polyangia bacterium]|nr:glycogen debranching enzyme GlgX [Polyangia bacterium]